MEELKKRIDKMYPTRASFAEALGVDSSVLSRMLKSGNWKADRIEKAVLLLNIEPADIPAYFFSDSVALKAPRRKK